MENGRRTEHSATEEEEVHLHYQSRRGQCTLWTTLFLLTTNHHGGHTNTHSLDTPIPTTYLHGGTTNTHSLDTPHPIPISTGAPLIHSFGRPLFILPNTTGATITHSSLDTPHPSTYLHGGTTNTLSFWTPLYLSTLPSYGRYHTFDYLSSFV